MSTQVPLRTVRIPVLQRQCLFQRRQCLDRPFPSSASRSFSSTSPRPYKKKTPRIQDKAQTEAAAASQITASPKVNFEKTQQESSMMADDIGLLQNTIIRAPFKDLPSLTSGRFWGYFWTLLKAKGTGFYSRSYYRRCMQKMGWSKWLPVDVGKNAQLKTKAQKLYEQIYANFAKGDASTLKQVCLPPLVKKFEDRIAARGPLNINWKLLKWRSARVVSHRASPLGEDNPDTAYRQVVVRLESVQALSITESYQTPTSVPSRRGNKGPSGLAWIPEEAKAKSVRAVQQEEGGFGGQFVDNGKQKTVVEYLVLQKRVIKGKEEEWKVWGFADESTPQKIEEDELYWRKMLNIQVAGGA
ncbi:Nn.00g037850.m01.CDS01 [Neocucurbitaria sp. VM-36]